MAVDRAGPCRVLVVFEHPTVSGGERSWLAVAPYLQAAGFQLFALAPEGPIAGALAGAGVAVRTWKTHLGGVRMALPDRRRLASHAIEALSPDLVHANSLAMARLVGPVAAATGTPCLGHLRDILRLSAAAIADLGACTGCVAVSAAVRDCLLGQGLGADRVEVIHNGVDLEAFHAGPGDGAFRAELGLPPDAVLAVALGQISLRKGTDVLVAAYRAAAAATPRLHLAIVGERFSLKDEAVAVETALRAATREPGLAGRLHVAPWRADVEQVLRDAEFVVHAARQEPLGRVLLEAAACGRAVLATDVGGTAEIFPAATDSARLVPAGDVEELAAGLVSLADDPQLRGRLGAAARRQAEKRFDVRRSADALVDCYRRTASLQPPNPRDGQSD